MRKAYIAVIVLLLVVVSISGCIHSSSEVITIEDVNYNPEVNITENHNLTVSVTVKNNDIENHTLSRILMVKNYLYADGERGTIVGGLKEINEVLIPSEERIFLVAGHLGFIDRSKPYVEITLIYDGSMGGDEKVIPIDILE